MHPLAPVDELGDRADLPPRGAGAPRPRRDAPPPGPFVLASEEVARFGEGRVVVRDGVLGAAAAGLVAAALRAHDARLTPGAVGRGADLLVAPAVRGDRSAWLEPAATPELGALWALFDAVGESLRERAWLGPLQREVQLALYPGDGAAYAPHRDAFAGGGRRRATAVWYANPDWRPEHGGALRVTEPEGARLVGPELDRLVLFDPRVEHAVLPAHAPRRAVTAWFLGPAAP